MNTVIVLDHIGVGVFAVSGVLAASERRMDIFGAIVLAIITGVGGGTLRDLLLGRAPVFWVHEPSYIVVAALAALGTFAYAHWRQVNRRALVVADAFGLGLFTVIGTSLTIELGFPYTIAVVMGVMTGVFGGIARDVLANKVPLILRQEIYATAALIGAIALVVMREIGVATPLGLLLASGVTVLIRLVAVSRGLALPRFPRPGREDPP